MILIAIGANLPSPRYGPPLATCEAALEALDARGVTVLRRSRWYESAPVPTAPDQPWYVNGVASVRTELDAADLLALLHGIEADFGRHRAERNAPRILDLDLLDYDGIVCREPAEGRQGPVLPHPRLQERAFVLLPLAEVAPRWRHPVSGASLDALIAALPAGQECRPMSP